MGNKTGYIDAVADAEAWRMAGEKAITIPGTDLQGLRDLYADALNKVNSSPWLAALRSSQTVCCADIEATRNNLRNEHL